MRALGRSLVGGLLFLFLLSLTSLSPAARASEGPTGPAKDLSDEYERTTPGVGETGWSKMDRRDLHADVLNEDTERHRRNYYAQEHEQQVNAADEYKGGLKRESDHEQLPARLQPDARGYIHFDGARVPVKEPMTKEEALRRKKVSDPWQVSERDLQILTMPDWTLREEDFQARMPRPITIQDRWNADRSYDVVQFTLTNSTNHDLPLSPTFYLLTTDIRDEHWERARRTPQVGGYFIRQRYRETLLRDVDSGLDLLSYLRTEPDGTRKLVGEFRAGETKSGVVVFARYPRGMEKMKLVVDGLNRTIKYDRRLKKVLVIDYERRTGDEYGPHEPPRVKDHRWAHWEWLWMWDQDIQIPPGSMPQRVETSPATRRGGRPKNYWYYLYTATNSTRTPQSFRITSFDTLAEVELSGFDMDGEPCLVEVLFPDDGRHNFDVERILRDRLNLEKLTDPVPDPNSDEGRPFATWLQERERYQGTKRFRHVRAPVPAQPVKKLDAAARSKPNPDHDRSKWFQPGQQGMGLVIFDEQGYDAEYVYRQVEEWLNQRPRRELYRTEDPSPPEEWRRLSLAHPQRPTRRRLTAKEKELIRHQLEAKLRAALVEQTRTKRIRARVTARSGLASGTRRIDRYYVVKAEIEHRSWDRWEQGWWQESFENDVTGDRSRKAPQWWWPPEG